MKLFADVPAKIVRLGVMRTYTVRHGCGPMPTHDPNYDKTLPEPHNDEGGWQGRFRRGPLDLVLLKYAIDVCDGADGLALTFLDANAATVTVCRSYTLDGVPFEMPRQTLRAGSVSSTQLSRDLERVQPQYEQIGAADLISVIETSLGVSVQLVSQGPTAIDRRWLRSPGVTR